MTPTEAVALIIEAAYKGHTPSCACLIKPGPTVRVGIESKCDCGAYVHNTSVKEALKVIGGAAKKR